MNVLWRTLFVMARAMLRRRREGTLPLDAVTRVRLTTLPTDIDLLRHMNNGRYLSLFDLGRWDMTTRTGLADTFRRNGWYAVVSNETITFRKSLELWQRFDIETRWIGHDDRALYLEHRAVVGDEIYARAVIRARIVRRSGGSVSHEEFFAALDLPDELPEVDAWLHDWAEASRLPSTRRPAPSDWT
ncbi:thioesterase family protein [Microbacterium sp. G2-8]|uniref:thioesterase family protein n=1 Tax=Microbacterium sp. G2-8 TaxID=2842454 RepID=UPI001C89EA08|nr:thioesterase family protein [Microbacterium sp. G2-8]